MEPDESVIWVIDPEDYKADVLFVFENGRVVRVALSGYVTKTNRKRLKNAIYGGSKLLYAQVLKEDRDIALVSSDYRLMNFNTSLLKTKTTTNTQGVQAFTARRAARSPPSAQPKRSLAPASRPRSSPRRASPPPVPYERKGHAESV